MAKELRVDAAMIALHGSTATSVPAPTAMPTSAVSSAGASFTPSPTMDGDALVLRLHLFDLHRLLAR